MEIRQLRHFLAVAEARNFRLAAERVNLSQQAVSKSILQLERSLSVSLFERGRQAVLLTEEGRQLLAYARDILADVRRFDDALADTMGRKHGHLRIGATPNLLSEIVPDTLGIFHERYPQARLSVDRGDFPLLRDTMLQGDLDLILCSSPEQIPRHLVTTTVIARDRNVVVVRKDHPLVQAATISTAMLADYPMLAIHNYPRGESYLERIFAGSPTPRPMLKAASTEFAMAWLRRSDFWWIAPLRQAYPQVRDGRLAILPLEPEDAGWDLVMAIRRHARPTPVVTAYCDILKTYLGAQNGNNDQLS
ncbi:MAG: LysR family transcriptional regulator [Novosphingobium sp.]